MAPWIKQVLQYGISLCLGAVLMWLVFKDADFTAMVNDIQQANFNWIFISFAFALFSHLARAYRWNLLMEPVNLKPSLLNSFFAVMVGYLANIALPRMGEVSRCAVLQRTDKIPVTTSLGTVVTERIFDLISLITIITITFLIEFDKLSGFVFGLFASKAGDGETQLSTVYFGIGSIVLFLLVVFVVGKLILAKTANSAFVLKLKVFAKAVIEGILSFRKLKKKKEFIAATVVIWVCYFFMSYVVFFALPATSHLGINAGLAVLVLGGLGMAAPVQGGMGAFHWIIKNGLVFYGLSQAEGLTFATIVHSSQMVMIIVVGAVSLVAALFLSREKKQPKLATDAVAEEFPENINA